MVKTQLEIVQVETLALSSQIHSALCTDFGIPKHKTEGELYGMYMNHPSNKNDKWDEEKRRKREAYKKDIYQRTIYGENST